VIITLTPDLKFLFYLQDNDDVQSDMDLDLLAESESDSETENESNDTRGAGGNANANNAGDNVGGASNVGGAANDAFFSDDDSGDSSHGDEDESEAGETDEQDGDDLTFDVSISGGRYIPNSQVFGQNLDPHVFLFEIFLGKAQSSFVNLPNTHGLCDLY
jgi:hypothetical protein